MSDHVLHSEGNIVNRPVLFTLLCILSFIANGFLVLMGLIGIFFSGYISGILEQYVSDYQSFGHGMLLISFFSVLLIFGLKLWGVILMFFGRKSGYIMYIIPSGLLMILYIVMISGPYSGLAISCLLMSIVFIILYGIFLKYMK